MIYLLYLYKSKKSLSRNSQVNRQPLPNPMEKGLKPFKYFYFTTKKNLFHLRLLFFYRAARFNSVDSLTIHFPSNFGEDNTKIYYIGLKGDFHEVSWVFFFAFLNRNVYSMSVVGVAPYWAVKQLPH